MAGAGAQALVVITFEQQALSIVREALESGIYTQFTFGDAAKRRRLVTEIGGERLGGMYGTAGAPAPDNEATAAWEASYEAEYGALPQSTYVKETYDAAIALALAAQAAGSLKGDAIRDKLRAIGSPPGETVMGTPQGVADGLRLLADGSQIDYEGIANSLDWDENGDLLQGYIGIWQYTQRRAHRGAGHDTIPILRSHQRYRREEVELCYLCPCSYVWLLSPLS